MVEGSTGSDTLELALKQAQLEQLQLENEKLKRELTKREKAAWYTRLIQIIPLITTFLAITSFSWGVVQYADQQTKNRAAQTSQAQRQIEATEREFMKPWLDSQRAIYMEALTTAATLANSDDPEKLNQAREDFWKLYWGKMILVETKELSGAQGLPNTRSVTSLMIDFGKCLDGSKSCSKGELNGNLSALATSMAQSMAATARMTYQEFSTNQFHYTAGP